MKKQIDSWVNNNLFLWQYWEEVSHNGNWEREDKTEVEVISLANYYEGRYDMALNIKELAIKEGTYG